DVWSIGVVWYECLSGKLPFEGGHPAAVLVAVTSKRATALSERVGVPALLGAAIDRALVGDFAVRYSSVEQFSDALVRAAERVGIRVRTDASTAGPSGAAAALNEGDTLPRFEARKGGGTPAASKPLVHADATVRTSAAVVGTMVKWTVETSPA